MIFRHSFEEKQRLLECSSMSPSQSSHLTKKQKHFSLGTIMQALWKRSHLQEALRLVQSNPTHLDNYNYLYMKILQLCIDERLERPGLLVHNHVITNRFTSNLNLNTKLINFYWKFGHIVSARNVFDNGGQKCCILTSMVSGYTQSGSYEKASAVFLEMRQVGFRALQFGYGSALRACTDLRCLKLGMQIQGSIPKGKFAENLFVQSVPVDFHSEGGKIEDSWRSGSKASL